MTDSTRITIAHGDGIGPEIMAATLKVLEAAKAPLDYDTINIGEQLFLQGISSGIEDSSWDVLRRNKIFLKAPITTPQGGGMKSLNVTVRNALGLYANVRPCTAYPPYIETNHPKMDVVIIRENEEGLYGGIEHQQTPEVVQCLRLMSIPGTRRIARYAFEYAKRNNRKKVTCFTKDNIMKQTDGMFHRIFDEIATDYPEIETNHYIIDIGTAKLANQPEIFDVILAPNLYGDIISDVAAEITGSVGLAGSANIGANCAMFEAIHGSAPDIAGQDIANPSGLLIGSVMMLVHLGLSNIASTIHNAWFKTIEDGMHTKDIYHADHSKQSVGTQGFADAVIERLGEQPKHFPVINYQAAAPLVISDDNVRVPACQRELKGVDVFIYWDPDKGTQALADKLSVLSDELKLHMMSNRGSVVWPRSFPETFYTDHWRARFVFKGESGHFNAITDLLTRMTENNIECIKTENLYFIDGQQAYSKGQGE